MATNKITMPWSAKGVSIKGMEPAELAKYRTENGIVVSGFHHERPEGGPKSGVWFKAGKTQATVDKNGKKTGTNRIKSYYEACSDDAQLHFFWHLEMRHAKDDDKVMRPYTTIYEKKLLSILRKGNHPKMGNEKFFMTPRSMGNALAELKKHFQKVEFTEGDPPPKTRGKK